MIKNFVNSQRRFDHVRAQNIFRLDRALLFIMLVPVSNNEGLKVNTPCHLLQQKPEVGACTNEPLASCNPLDWNIGKEKQTQTNKQKSRRVHQISVEHWNVFESNTTCRQKFMDTKSLMADLTLLSLPGFWLNYMTDKK